MMRDRDDANLVALNTVDQRIGKTVKRQHSYVVNGLLAHRRKVTQQTIRLIECIGEILCGYKSALTDISVGSSIGIGLRFVAKTDSHQLWRRLFLRGAWP